MEQLVTTLDGDLWVLSIGPRSEDNSFFVVL